MNCPIHHDHDPENLPAWRWVLALLTAGLIVWYLFDLVDEAYPDERENAADSVSQPDIALLEAWAPTRDFTRVGAFLLAYDGRTRCARWTLERLTPASLKGPQADRAGLRFTVDKSLPPEFAAKPADYQSAGYDVGHCAAAGNHAASAEQLKATFTPANAAPQTPALNRGPWRALETYLRGVGERTRGVWVVTAPLWLPSGYHQVCLRRDGEQCLETRRVSFFSFQALGEGCVWIPTHWGKAALIEHSDGRLEARAWILSNTAAADQPDFEDHETSVDRFETASGLDVFSPLPDDQEAALERGTP